MLWRKQSETDAHNEVKGGLTVVSETRIVPGIGREFMPPLDEGSFLYMPSLLPQGGLGPAIEVNAKQDMAIATVPEVESVVGKLGRAETALDPAPIGMMESIIILKPEDEWRQVAGAALVLKLARLAQGTAGVDRAGASSDHEKRDPHRVAGEDRHPRRAADFPPTDSNAPDHASDRLPRHDGREDLRR
jgi:hypothetical protein